MEKATSGELLWKLGEKGKEKQGNNEALHFQYHFILIGLSF